MRHLDLRELIELLAGTLAGAAAVWLLNHFWPPLFRGYIGYREWLGIGAAAGFLMAVTWSGRQVEQRIDHRIPQHLRKPPSYRDGRPVGVFAWRTRDAASEYLWLVMGVVVVLMIIWLAKTFVPQWWR
ncbi:MAG: hypothetical protein ABI679_02010 [Gemmatimonadota bacterium]